MERIAIGPDRRQWVIVAAVGCSLAALGIVLILATRQVVVGWVALVICGAGGLFAAWQFYDMRPRVVIDDRGVLDRTFGIGVIPWDDIQDVHLKWTHGRPQLCLDLRNAKRYTARLPQMLQRVAALNRELGLTDLSVDLSGATPDPATIEAAIRHHVTSSRPPSVTS